MNYKYFKELSICKYICPIRPLCYSVQFLPAYLEVPGSCEMVENEKWLKVRG